MLRLAALAALAALLGTAAQAQETIEFEADAGVVFTRCTDFAVETVCEMIFPPSTAMGEYICVAINASGDAIGVVAAPTVIIPSGAWFQDLALNEIADVQCRRR